ncbi:hypothetical protein [Bdellovibrio svalbardensis]|uniref:Uncharacterized protein n=1 Tax=Bdellovibrio svalbardensis TaxID=2972972 RepID=A0ABT6DIJ3_9BACT|nr:hypothetical protein [Bdellovibrio svalbardensis]MDG0814923.1 hypothetical protein [Bdellovibrio svalbardensis]
MKKVLISHLLVSALGSFLIAIFTAAHQGYSFLAGSLVIFLSFLMLGIGFSLIFEKKLIALAISIIVFKYAILGIIIFTIVKLPWFTPLWFAMGVASFVLSAIYFAIDESLRSALKEGNDNVI